MKKSAMSRPVSLSNCTAKYMHCGQRKLFIDS